MDTIAASSADSTAIMYINKRITELDNNKKELVNQIDNLKNKREKDKTDNYEELKDTMSKWDVMEFD